MLKVCRKTVCNSEIGQYLVISEKNETVDSRFFYDAELVDPVVHTSLREAVVSAVNANPSKAWRGMVVYKYAVHYKTFSIPTCPYAVSGPTYLALSLVECIAVHGKTVKYIYESDRCEWNPTENREALDSDPYHGDAVLSVGTGHRNIHLCELCSKLPKFAKWKKVSIDRE